MADVLDAKAIRARLDRAPIGQHIDGQFVHEVLDTLILSDLPACLDVIEQMAGALERCLLDYLHLQDIDQDHGPYFPSDDKTVIQARAALALVKR